ncbi:MAG: sulfite exporter TauE/SafE family protein [Bacteroidetes bacterium]|nr:sulfite exporter TauE/SafE family protein [Bacteroidota bacterium]
MEYVLICIVAFLASVLTLFSGFGLGTILVPVFALFFPIDFSIVCTAIVHFLNNFFKLLLVGEHADRKTVLRFGIPAIIFSFLGAMLLSGFSNFEPIATYQISNNEFEVTPAKLTIGILVFLFALLEVIPKYSSLAFDRKYLCVGGILSGFFGGLSGNQGALRSAFLVKANLSKEGFIATGVVIACLVDLSRLSVYAQKIVSLQGDLNYTLMMLATISAFIGTYLGNKFIKKTTINFLKKVVTVMLLLFSVLLATGII